MELRRIPFTMRILTKLSQEGSFEYFLEDTTGDYAYLLFNNGVRHYVSRSDIRVNLVGPHEIAKNKFLTDSFLGKKGFPVISSRLFYSKELCEKYDIQNSNIEDAVSYALHLGYPLIVKPNNGFQGTNIYKVTNEESLRHAFELVLGHSSKVLIQKFMQASDYRLVVYRGELMFAYKRLPLQIVGDGKQSIQSYLEGIEERAHKSERTIKIDHHLVASVVDRFGYTLSSVLARGEVLQLLDNANLSTGGRAEDVSDFVHPEYRKIVKEAVETLNLSLAGVDLLVSGDISEAPVPGTWSILEVNASPGFEGFAQLGNEQEKKVVTMFRKILLDIERGEYKS